MQRSPMQSAPLPVVERERSATSCRRGHAVAAGTPFCVVCSLPVA